MEVVPNLDVADGGNRVSVHRGHNVNNRLQRIMCYRMLILSILRYIVLYNNNNNNMIKYDIIIVDLW